LIAAYHSISKAWHRETLLTGRRIPPLLRAIITTRSLLLHNLQPLDIFLTPAYETSGLRFLPPSTLQAWEIHLKCFTNLDHEERVDRDAASSTLALDGFDVHIEDDSLQPTLTSSDTIPAMDDRRSRVGQTPTGASLASLVSEVIPLNRKQQMDFLKSRVLRSDLLYLFSSGVSPRVPKPNPTQNPRD
jgi:hypothetical protein